MKRKQKSAPVVVQAFPADDVIAVLPEAVRDAIERARLAIRRWDDFYYCTRTPRKPMRERLLRLRHARVMATLRARLRASEKWAAWATDERLIADCDAIVALLRRYHPHLAPACGGIA